LQSNGIYGVYETNQFFEYLKRMPDNNHMIYLIITTSISNRYGIQAYEQRKERYLFAIQETLRLIPSSIQPIIVENNGKRSTFLDSFEKDGKKVPVLYTDHNAFPSKSKGVNEMMDIKEVIRHFHIQEEDIVVKITGRYRLLSSMFLKEIEETQNEKDVWMKFFGTCSLQFETYDCILGCYAIRARYLQLFQPISIDNYQSAEIGFARYVRFCGARIQEMKQLDLECIFAEDNRLLEV
jgi:hypothetical protein